MTHANSSITVLAAMLAALALPAVSEAQESEGPLYLQLDCMRSKSADYVDVETEIWKPIHQQAVKQGKIAGWALYQVRYGDSSECDYYTLNTYRGVEQLNADRAYGDLFAVAHPGKDWDEALERTGASRVHVWSQLWIGIDGIPPKEHRFLGFNHMYAEDGPAYEAFERGTWKPVHQALIDRGHSAGWELYRLVSPHGMSIPYNYAAVDYLKQIGPLPVEETMRSVHSEREAAELLQAGPELRDHVYGGTWVFITSTESGS